MKLVIFAPNRAEWEFQAVEKGKKTSHQKNGHKINDENDALLKF